MRSILAAALALALPLPALSHDYRAGTLSIAHPTTPGAPPTAHTAAGYLSLTNEGDEADFLVAVESHLPSASVHRSEVVDGIATMSPVDRVEIPAGETVTLEPGGLHVMFMGLDAPLAAEGGLSATLVFERAGPVEVTFRVESRGAITEQKQNHDHGHD